MYKKKIFSVFLMVVFLVSLFSGCGESSTYSYYIGDEITRDTLRICVDSWCTDQREGAGYKEAKIYFEDLAAKIKANTGIEKIVFEMLPQHDSSRKAKLQRLKTEIMAGNGPDVFIVQTTHLMSTESGFGRYEDVIFSYPEKSMEVGLFLPLDEYMENNSRFTDWSAQTQTVLSAGRSDEGQVIIPMTYDLPFLIYPKDEFDISYSQDMTRQEILNDSETAGIGAILYSTVAESSAPISGQDPCNPIRDSLGQYADYENEELLFTEEELYTIVNEAFQLEKQVVASEWPFYEWSVFLPSFLAGRLKSNTEVELIPRYNKDGGVTARVTNFMAVNRSTKFPKEAFSVIDYLMQEDMQRSSQLFNFYFYNGFPLQNDLGSEEKSWDSEGGKGDFLSEQHMEELLSIKEQITVVNIESGLDFTMREMVIDLKYGGYSNDGSMTEVPREVVAKAYEDMARAMKE